MEDDLGALGLGQREPEDEDELEGVVERSRFVSGTHKSDVWGNDIRNQ